MLSLSEELQGMQCEEDSVLKANVQSSAETDKLFSTVTSLTEERDQLKMDLQENVEMVSSHVSFIFSKCFESLLLFCQLCSVELIAGENIE